MSRRWDEKETVALIKMKEILRDEPTFVSTTPYPDGKF